LPLEAFFAAQLPLDVTHCPGVPASLRKDDVAEVAVRLYRGEGVSDADLAWVTALAQQYFGDYAVLFRAREPSRRLPVTAVIDGDPSEIDAAVRAAGVEPRSEDGQRVAAALAYAPLRTLLERHAQPAEAGMNLVLLEDVARRGSLASAIVGEVAGVGLSPRLLRDPEVFAPVLAGALHLTGEPFTPTLVLSTRQLRAMSPVEAMSAIAHEIGHAAGLGHDTRAWNVMTATRRPCRPGLAAEQLASLRAGGFAISVHRRTVLLPP
jgi:hypothetical protein